MALATSLWVGAVSPVAPSNAEMVVVSPKAKSLGDLRTFLEAASAYAPVLAPGPLGRELGSALSLDVFDLEAWKSAGLDPEGGFSFVSTHDTVVLVLPVHDPKAVLTRAKTSLASFGQVAPGKLKGGDLLVATQPSKSNTPNVTAAVGVKNNRVALLLDGNNLSLIQASLDARNVPGFEHTQGLAGGLYALGYGPQSTWLAVGFTPSAKSLDLDGRMGGPTPLAASVAQDPFANLSPPAQFSGHLVLSSWSLGQAKGFALRGLDQAVHQVCTDCGDTGLSALLNEFSGPVALVASGILPERSHGASELDRFFMLPQAEAAQTKSEATSQAKLKAVIDGLKAHHADADVMTLSTPGEHYRLRLGGGRAMLFGRVGDIVYAASDEHARDTLLGALPSSGGKPEHAGAARLDGPLIARSLSGLSLLDAARSAELAALVAAAVEAGPLLNTIGQTNFIMDPDGKAVRIKGQILLGAEKNTGATP
jgi:hypothetical protein